MSSASLVVAAALLVAVASGCSEFMVQSATGKYKMTARTSDFQATFDSRIRGLKQGSTMTFPAVCPTCKPTSLQTKYDIVGATPVIDYEYMFTDGLNSAGLSVAWLYDDGVQPVQNATGTRQAIPFLYVASFILAKFKTVAEVQAAMKPEMLELTNAWATPDLPLFTFPIHFGINDATGATAVLELAGDQEKVALGQYVVRDNTLHTLTNSPNLPQHDEYFAAYTNDPTLVPPYVPDNLDAMFPSVDVKSRYVNVPGDATSASRRIRLALFRQLQEQGGALPHNVSYFGYLPDNAEAWSPNYGGNEWRDTFAMTVNSMQHVVIVNGLSEGIKVNNVEALNNPYDPFKVAGVEHTLFMQVRDHTNLVYFWWTHRAQRWQSIDLKGMQESFLTCLSPLPSVSSSILDRTAEANGVGVQVYATGPVEPRMCWAAQCPTVLRGLGIRCRCEGERAYRSSGACAAPLSRSDAHEIIKGFPWNQPRDYPVVPLGDKGALTIQVTSCGHLGAQKCCSVFAAAVRAKQTLLPETAPISCIGADGATLAPSPL